MPRRMRKTIRRSMEFKAEAIIAKMEVKVKVLNLNLFC
jgi:hypothetical protein